MRKELETTETRFQTEDEGGGSAAGSEGRRGSSRCRWGGEARSPEQQKPGHGIRHTGTESTETVGAGHSTGKLPRNRGDGSCLFKGTSLRHDNAGPQQPVSPASWTFRKGKTSFSHLGKKQQESRKRKPDSRQTGRARPGGNAGTDVRCSGKKHTSGSLYAAKATFHFSVHTPLPASKDSDGATSLQGADDRTSSRRRAVSATGRGTDAVGGVGTASVWQLKCFAHQAGVTVSWLLIWERHA